MNPNNNEKRLTELDSLRGIACLMVFFFHHSIRFIPNDKHFLFHFGYLGVDLFFIISGFVIYLTLERTNYWMDFIVNRCSRLYPAYWLAVLITFLAVNYSPFSSKEYPNFMLISNLTMFQHWIGIQDIDLAYWTLNLELSFYFFMFVIFLLRGIKYYKLLTLIMLLPIWLNYVFPGLDMLNGLFDFFTFFRFGHLFAAGIVFYNVFKRKGSFKVIDGILLILCFISGILVRKESVIIEQIHIAVFFFLFILLVKDKLSWISHPVLLFYGQISYVLYLIHENVGLEVLKFFNYWSLENWYVTRGLLLLFFTVICFLISTLYEKPMQKHFKMLWVRIKGISISPSLVYKK